MSIPKNIEDLFLNGESTYNYIDYTYGMDNNQAMQIFLEYVNPSDTEIILVDGSQAFLECQGFDFIIQVDSGGGGDFHNHQFKVTHLDNSAKNELL